MLPRVITFLYAIYSIFMTQLSIILPTPRQGGGVGIEVVVEIEIEFRVGVVQCGCDKEKGYKRGKKRTNGDKE